MMLKNRAFVTIKNVVEKTDTLAGFAFDIFFQCLIIISIISFSLETVPELSIYQNFFEYSEIIIVVFFTTEYFLRILVADKKLDFIFSFYGLIDFFAIAPFYFSFGAIDLRSIRVFRFVRLLRTLKLARYSTTLTRMKDAFYEIKRELIIFTTLTLFLIYIASVGIYYFEHDAQPEHFKSIFHSMWWSISTLTTVGYGDVYPITVGGKIFTFFILILGLGLISVPSGLIASAFTTVNKKNNMKNK